MLCGGSCGGSSALAKIVGTTKTLIDNLTDGDDSNNMQGVLDWQVNTGQDLSFDDLGDDGPNQPVCLLMPLANASASARNKFFQPEPFIDDYWPLRLSAVHQRTAVSPDHHVARGSGTRWSG